MFFPTVPSILAGWRRAHKIVLESELAEIIERRWTSREHQTPSGSAVLYVFHTGGRPVGDFRKAWCSACKAAGLVKPKLDENGKPVMITVNGQKEPVMSSSRLFHDLRRSGVRNMVRAGVREGVAMAISGHRTRAIFDRYNITSDDDLRQAVKQPPNISRRNQLNERSSQSGNENQHKTGTIVRKGGLRAAFVVSNWLIRLLRGKDLNLRPLGYEVHLIVTRIVLSTVCNAVDRLFLPVFGRCCPPNWPPLSSAKVTTRKPRETEWP